MLMCQFGCTCFQCEEGMLQCEESMLQCESTQVCFFSVKVLKYASAYHLCQRTIFPWSTATPNLDRAVLMAATAVHCPVDGSSETTLSRATSSSLPSLPATNPAMT